MLIVTLITIGFFSFILIKSSGVVGKHLHLLAQKTSMSSFLVTSLLLGIATSLPELFIGVTSALEGNPAISVGNVIGANIANVSLVVGLAALIAGNVKISKDGGQIEDLLYAFAATAVLFLLMADGTLSRIDGITLIAIYGVYNYLIIRRRKKLIKSHENAITMLLRKLRSIDVRKHLFYIVVGALVMLASADMIVKLSMFMAVEAQISLFSIGLLIVAIGTSLPELAFEINAIRKKESEMFMGNILGSVVVNSTLIAGITSTLSPVHLAHFSEYLMSIAFFCLLFILFSFFVLSHRTFTRTEGGILVGIYFLFFVLQIM